jgi:hypothetical protein
MDIKPDRMVYLGYGKYWRSDAIVGLMPIEHDRGPGRRTEVHTATLDDPIVASRSEQAILQDMAYGTEDAIRIQEARETLGDLADALDDIPDVVRRLLASEARFDVDLWMRRLRNLLRAEGAKIPDESQNDLFG